MTFDLLRQPVYGLRLKDRLNPDHEEHSSYGELAGGSRPFSRQWMTSSSST